MHSRRQAREIALKALYAHEMDPESDSVLLIEFLGAEDGLPRSTVNYALGLVAFAVEKQEELDALLVRHAANWDLRRMAAIDRNVLRMAAAELLKGPEVPFKVVIDEAVEIAKLYSTEESGRFVNGIIDSCRRELAAENTNLHKDKALSKE